MTPLDSPTGAHRLTESAVSPGVLAAKEPATRAGILYFLEKNVGATISAAAAFLLFVGNGYYGKLFGHFGLKPSLLALSQVELATIGLHSTTFAFWQMIQENAIIFVAEIACVLAVILLLVALSRRWPCLREIGRRSTPVLDRFSSKWVTITKGFIVAFFGLSGLIAGDMGGSYDARYFEHARVTSHTCYSVFGVLYRGTVLAQDQTRTVLLHPTRVSIIRNDDLAFVRGCPAVKIGR